MKKDQYIIFHSNSTPTYDIAGTAVVKCLKNNFPEKKIIVVTNFPEIWLHNPNVFRVYRLGQTPYFYEDYVNDKNSVIFAHNPTSESDYLNKKNHIIESWCQMCGVKWAGPDSDEKPSLYFTDREKEVSMRLTQTDKPIFLIQPYEMFGALSPAGWSWPKDMPIFVANQIVNKMSQKGYAPVIIKGKNQKPIGGAMNLEMNLRQTMATLFFTEKRLFVDSFMAATAAALELPSVVTFLATHPKQNGYPENKNMVMDIKTELKEEIDQYHPTLDVGNAILQKNIDTIPAYDIDKILEALDKTGEVTKK